MICQPPEDWVRRKRLPLSERDFELTDNSQNDAKMEKNDAPLMFEEKKDEPYIHWKQALKMKEFYLLWITRLSIVLITQV